MRRATTSSTSTSNVAILPWGGVIEDYLEPIGLAIDDFVEQQTGGWLFGYVQSLHGQNTHVTIIGWSSKGASATRRTHLPTGATILEAPPLDPDGLFGRTVGGFAAALDRGASGADALAQATSGAGWQALAG